MKNPYSKFSAVSIFAALILLISAFTFAQEADPIMYWDFSSTEQRITVEQISGIADTLEGNFGVATGINGKGLRLDGFTACLIHADKGKPVPVDAFTIEAWVSLGNYPWNWCPVLTTESNGTNGYRLMIGPHGQVALESAIAEKWITCATGTETIPLRQWMHIAGELKHGSRRTLLSSQTRAP